MILANYHADRLKEAREKAGLSQSDVAREAPVTQPRLSLYERGMSVPSVEELAQLGDVYGYGIQDMIERCFTFEREGAEVA